MAVLMVSLVACAPGEPGTVTGRLLAGPTCPVETDPPDPACAPMPVPAAGVTVMVGGEEFHTVSGVDGRFEVTVPAGRATLVFDQVEGLMVSPEPIQIVVVEQGLVDVGDVLYDTGIR
jgi:hypothetical protein